MEGPSYSHLYHTAPTQPFSTPCLRFHGLNEREKSSLSTVKAWQLGRENACCLGGKSEFRWCAAQI